MERAAKLFDSVIVAVGANPTKSPLLSVQSRLEALAASVEHLPNVRVDAFTGLLVAYAREAGAQAVVRGLRATSDFDYEFQMAMANRRLAPEIETVFLMTKWEHSFLSSSIVREVALLGGDFSEFVPKPVERVIRACLASRPNASPPYC